MIVVIATRNRHKIEEIKVKYAHLNSIEFRAISQYDNIPEIEETGTTFSENALIKAREVAKLTGEAAMADDSGIVVDALGGEPGIYSARYGGEGLSDEERTDLLLENLGETPPKQRTARFQCAIAIVIPHGKEFTTMGTCEGTIAMGKRGNMGFGYDPIFIPKNHEITMAQMAMEEKNKISHRAKALELAESILEGLTQNEQR